MERVALPLVALLYAIALAPFASVHPGPRLLVAVTLVLLGGWAAWIGLRRPSLPWTTLLVLALLAVALGLTAAAFLPIDAQQRASLQPAVSEPVGLVLGLVGQPRHSLALEPRRALEGMAFALGVGLAAAGAALLARSLRRARRVAWWLVGTGAFTVLLAALHWTTDAASIYWSSAVPSYARDPFFAPYVNPNQGGAACAALLPLALALTLRKDLPRRLVALGASGVLVMGITASGSRGAILEAGVALALFGVLLGSRTVQMFVGLALLAGLALLLYAGPVDAAHHFSTWVSPDWSEADLLLGRGGIWHATTVLVDGAPLLGVGAGSYGDAYQVVKAMPEFTTTAHAHQDYLQALAEHGLTGGVAWISLALAPLLLGAAACLRLHRGRRRSMLAGYVASVAALLVSSTVTFSAHIGALAVLMAVVGGVAVARSGRDLRGLAGAWRQAATALITLLLLAGLSTSGFAWVSGRDPGSAWAPASTAIALGDEAYDRARSQGAGEADLSQAIDWYSQALARRPLDAETLFKLARARWLGGEREQAVQLLELSTGVYPTLIWSWLHLARAHRALRQPQQARLAYARLLALDLPSGQSATPYIREALLTSDDMDLVLAEVLPDRADRLRDAANLADSTGEVQLAEDLFQRALELDPQGGVSYASFLLRRFRYAEAYQLVEHHREGCFPLRVAGGCLLALQRYPEALERLQAAQSACGSDDKRVRANIALARVGMGDSAGIQVIELLLDESPDAHGLRRNLMVALRERGQVDELLEHLEVLVLAGVATETESRQLLRLRRGLPPR